MRDDDCVRFLQWALPRLGLRWSGFRKVRRQVCKRLSRRLTELGLDGLDGYRARLGAEPGEWRELDRMCRITISRLWRDRETFRWLEHVVLPELASRAVGSLDVWSCGCASGEEPYSLSMLWHERLAARFPEIGLRILATDIDLHLLLRAGRAVYPVGATREVPWDVASTALEPVGGSGDEVRVPGRFCRGVHLAQHDVRDGALGGPFHLILCRNLVFTYFDHRLQQSVGAWLVKRLVPGGAIVLGGRETIPQGVRGVTPWPGVRTVWRETG